MPTTATTPTPKRRRATQLDVLSAMSTYDRDKKRKRVAEPDADTAEVTPPNIERATNDNELRAALLDAGGDIAAGPAPAAEETKEEEEDTNVPEKFHGPPPPKRDGGRCCFEAQVPTNALVSLQSLKGVVEETMVCPVADCASKEIKDNKLTIHKSLEVEHCQHGFATEIKSRN